MKRWPSKRMLEGVFILVLWNLSFGIAHAQSFTWWTARSTDKILQSTTPANPFDATAATLYSAKNEFESFQIAVRSGAPLIVSDVTLGSLTDAAGHTIAGSDIMIYREGYLNVTTPSTIVGATGMVPDPLIPRVDDYFGERRNAFPYFIPANTTQAFWIEIYVPPTAPAGTYSGLLNITTLTTTTSVAVSVNVWGFALPSTSSLKSAFGMTVGNLQMGHDGGYVSDSRAKDLMKIYGLALLRHRISADSLTYPAPGETDWVAFDADWGPFLDGGSVTLSSGQSFNLATGKLPGAKLTTLMLSDYGFQGNAAYYANYVKHFTIDHKWFDWGTYRDPSYTDGPRSGARLFYYACDEPPAGCAWSAIAPLSSVLHSTQPSNPVLVTTSEERAASAGVTGLIDLLTPTLSFMQDRPSSQGGDPTYAGNQRSLYGPEAWWYQGCDSHGCNIVGGSPASDPLGYYLGWPSVMADLPNIYSRIQESLSYQYNIQGELYYETVYAYAGNPAICPAGGAVPWTSILCFGGNGDGTLFYPGTPAQVGGTHDIPIESIRLKQIRDGMEDYEYWKILEGKYGRPWVESNVIGAYLADVSSGQFVTYDWNTNAGTPAGTSGLLAARRIMGDLLSGIADFALSGSPSSMTVIAGTGATTSVTIASVGGFSSAVGLSCSVPQNIGIGCTLSSSSETPPAGGVITATLSITTQVTTPGGTYPIGVAGIFQGASVSTQFSLTVQAVPSGPPPDFTISANPLSLSVGAGGATTATLGLASLNGFNAPVSLSCTIPSSAIGCSVTPLTVSPPAGGVSSATLTINAQSSAPLGSLVVTIQGSSGALSHAVSTTLLVQMGDSFNRPNSTSLGSNWNVYLPTFEILNDQITNVDTGSKAAQFTPSIGPDQDIAADCSIAASGNMCAVMARWSDAGNFYRVRLDVGQGNLVLFKTVNGVTTLLGTAPRTLSYFTPYRIRLVVIGTSLSVYFAAEGSPAISLTDTSLTSGNYSGLLAYTSAPFMVSLDNFAAASAANPPLFSDAFNRTTGLGSAWSVYSGGFSTDGSHAISTGSVNFAGIAANLGTNDYAVNSVLVIPAGSSYSGIVARANPATNFYADLYAAQMNVTTGLINLYRRNSGLWTLLQSAAAPGGLNVGTPYRLTLRTVGSNPVNLEVAFQGVPLFSYTDSSAGQLSSGIPGLENYDPSVKYSSFSVTAP